MAAAEAPAQPQGHDHKRHSRGPGIKFLAKPAAATAGDRIAVAGRVRRRLGKRRSALRVVLQMRDPRAGGRKGRRFAKRAIARIRRRGRFLLRFRTPRKAGFVRLRLRLLRGGKTIARTRAWTLSIRAVVPAASVQATPTSESAAQASQTIVLDPGLASVAPRPGEAGELRLSGQFDLKPGDILALGAGAATPYGFLGRVVSATRDASGTSAQVTPATLPEALPQGSFAGQIDPQPIDSEALGAAVPVAGGVGGVPSQPRAQAQKTYKCEFDSSFAVTGSVELDSRIEVSGSWSLFSSPKARFVAHLTGTGKLEIGVDAAVSCGISPKTLFLVPLAVVTFWAGPVPVVLVPAVSASLKGEAEIGGSVTTSASASVSAEAGVDYYDGQAHAVGAVTPVLTSGSPPTPAGSGHVGATISPAINVLIYGVGGPQAALNAGLSLDASLGGSPLWTLTAPVSATASIAIPALNIGSPELTIWQNSYLLGQG